MGLDDRRVDHDGRVLGSRELTTEQFEEMNRNVA
jgi:hypothetical protein